MADLNSRTLRLGAAALALTLVVVPGCSIIVDGKLSDKGQGGDGGTGRDGGGGGEGCPPDFTWNPVFAGDAARFGIVVDGNNRAHVVYVQAAASADEVQVKHAWYEFDQGSWNTQAVLSTGVNPEYLALALDESSRLHLFLRLDGDSNRIEWGNRSSAFIFRH